MIPVKFVADDGTMKSLRMVQQSLYTLKGSLLLQRKYLSDLLSALKDLERLQLKTEEGLSTASDLMYLCLNPKEATKKP